MGLPTHHPVTLSPSQIDMDSLLAPDTWHTDPIVSVEIEAVFSKAVQMIAWRELQDHSVWRQGWV